MLASVPIKTGTPARRYLSRSRRRFDSNCRRPLRYRSDCRAIERSPATRAEVRQDLARPKPGRPKAYVFNYRPQNKAFNLKLRFRKGTVPKEEVEEAAPTAPVVAAAAAPVKKKKDERQNKK